MALLMRIVDFKVAGKAKRTLPTLAEKKRQREKELKKARELKSILETGMTNSPSDSLVEYAIRSGKVKSSRKAALRDYLNAKNNIPKSHLVSSIAGTPLLSELLDGLIFALTKLNVDEGVSSYSSIHLYDNVNLQKFDTTMPYVRFERSLFTITEDVFGLSPNCIWKLHSYAVEGIVTRDRESAHRDFRDWKTKRGEFF
jgi:hypothetical protein